MWELHRRSTARKTHRNLNQKENMSKIRKVIIVICVVTIIVVLVYCRIVLKFDWTNMISAMTLSFIASIAVCIIRYKVMTKRRKQSILLDGGPGNDCCESLFTVNGTQWKLPHTGVCSFNEALKYEDHEWRLATLADFSLLNKYVKYPVDVNNTINVHTYNFSFYLKSRYWTGNVTQLRNERVVAAVQYYPTGFQPFHGHLPDINIDEKAGVILVKREVYSAMKSYIEVLISNDDIDTWNLAPGIYEKFHTGDKIAIDRGRIKEPDFMLGILSDDTRNGFFRNEHRYFGSSNICFIQIIEKIYHENHVELHGKKVPEDGLFYSN